MNKILILLIAFSLSITSCKKTGTLKVTVNKQSVGQPSELAIGAVVIAKSLSNSDRFYMAQTNNEGIAMIDDIKQDSYKVSSEAYDGSGFLRDEDVADVRSGNNSDVVLLLQ